MSFQKKSFNSSIFYAHHVGGKGGGCDFPMLPKFKDEIVNVIYEADDTSLEQIKESFNHRNVIVKPYCLFEHDGTAKFKMCHCPYTGTLYELNPELGHYYHEGHDKLTDYVFSGSLKTIRTFDVETKKLDTIIKNNMVPSPDFLSMDVQGAALPIMRGSKETLNKTIVGMEVEINFAPVFGDSPLFSEFDEFMRKNNFFLASIYPDYIGYHRIYKKFRGAGVPVQAQAVYFHKPDYIEAENDYKTCLKLEKLALATLAYGHTEIAFKSMELAKKMNLKKENNSYQEFLYLFHDKIKKETNLPGLWHERWSHEKIRDRAKPGRHYFSDILKTHKHMLKKKPIRHSFYLINRLFSKIFFKIFNYIKKIPNFFRLDISIIPKTTKFEKFLLQNGFTKAVKHIKERRAKFMKLHIPG